MYKNRHLILNTQTVDRVFVAFVYVEKMKKVTLFVTRCDIEIGVNYPCNACHRLTLFHFELDL